jgi:hypothetical protein
VTNEDVLSLIRASAFASVLEHLPTSQLLARPDLEELCERWLGALATLEDDPNDSESWDFLLATARALCAAGL